MDAGICEGVKAVGKSVGGNIGRVAVGAFVLVQPEVQTAIANVIESASKWMNFFN